jgi:flagellum-specific ATP synthase
MTEAAGTNATRIAPKGMAALRRLEQAATTLTASPEAISVAGLVSEIAPSYFRVVGLSPFVRLGECIAVDHAGTPVLGEIVRIEEQSITVKPLVSGLSTGIGARAWRHGFVTVRPHDSWKGRSLNALAEPIDGGPPLQLGPRTLMPDSDPPPALTRQRVKTPIRTGVRVIDLFTPLCAGQRIGIFAGSGVGKSTLLAMLARSRGFDTTVVALVGERGREAREFLEDALGADRSRTIAVVSTGDESPMMRRLAPKTALCIAEYLRDQGESVLLIVDSVTRFAHAARDVALAAGEPPVARGYTPSVFSDLPRLLERAGPGAEGRGSITGVFSVLVDGDDHNDPVADSIRGTLDGHIVLDRAIADQGRYPAVDILGSVSRLAQNVWTPDQRKLVLKLKSMIAQFEDTRDLRLMGGYRAGADADLDKAIETVPRILEAMGQSPEHPQSVDPFQEVARALQAAQTPPKVP